MKKHIHWCEWMRRISLILTIGMFTFFWVSFADFSAAKQSVGWRDISSGGVALWIFVILGGIIILLQLVPAIIMFFSIVGGVHKSVEVNDEIEVPCCEAKNECGGCK